LIQELEPSKDEVQDEAEEDRGDNEGQDGCPGSSLLLEFIEGVKVKAGITTTSAATEGSDTKAEPEAEGSTDGVESAAELGVKPEARVKARKKAHAEAAAAAERAQEQLDEMVMVARKVLDEGRGLGLATRDELQALLQRCATTEGDGVLATCAVDRSEGGTADLCKDIHWREWETLLLTSPPQREQGPQEHGEPAAPPDHLSAKEKKKWLKKQEKLARRG